jgi:rhodanese-related sulfurtransferase
MLTRSIRRLARPGISVHQAVREIDLLIVDVRSAEEVTRGGGARNAKHIPLADLPKSNLGDDKTRPIIFYCQRGIRAAQAAQFAMSQGYVNSFSATDGQTVDKLTTDK